jgi:hypothetical protein
MAWQWWCAGVTGVDAMARYMHAMLGSMVILVVPSFAICTGIALMLYRRREPSAGK